MLAPLSNLFISSNFVEPPGCAAHSEDCPACEADQTNLLPFTNNELGHVTQQTPGQNTPIFRPSADQSNVGFFLFCFFALLTKLAVIR